MRSDISLEMPGRLPLSISAFLTQSFRVWGAQPIFATHREDGFDVTTLEIRTDRATGQTAIAVAYEREPS